MRSAGLLAIAVLAVVLAASSLAHAQQPGVYIMKVTTNDDTTTEFQFAWSSPEDTFLEVLRGGETRPLGNLEGIWTIVETVPDGWALEDISCDVSPQGDTVVTVDLANAEVIIDRPHEDIGLNQVVCTFTNSPISPAVGGVVLPANNFAIVAPWLVVIGLVGCIGTIVVVAKKRC